MKRKLIAFFGGVALLLLAETVLRLTSASKNWSEFKFLNNSTAIMEEDHATLWRSVNNLDTELPTFRVKTDQNGFRCNNTCESLPISWKGYRIFCLGGSVTFGWGVDNQFTYPAQLQSLFQTKRNPPAQITVTNAGVMGFTTTQALVHLERKVIKYYPDCLVVCFTINDQQPTEQTDSAKIKNLASLAWTAKRFLSHSALFNNLLRASIIWQVNHKQHHAEHRTPRVPLQEYQANLKSFIRIAHSLNAKLIFMTEYITSATGKDNYQTTMISIAKRHGISCIDAAKIFSQYAQTPGLLKQNTTTILDKIVNQEGRKEGRKEGTNKHLVKSVTVEPKFIHLFVDDWHPNERGHKLIAETLFDLICKEVNFNELN